eukprot:774630_1
MQQYRAQEPDTNIKPSHNNEMIETTQNEADIALKQMAKYHLSQIPIPNKIIKQMIKPFTSKIIDPKGEIEMPSENDRSDIIQKFPFMKPLDLDTKPPPMELVTTLDNKTLFINIGGNAKHKLSNQHPITWRAITTHDPTTIIAIDTRLSTAPDWTVPG